MSASPCEFPPINVHFPGVNSVISEIPVEWSTSPSSLIADEEQLTRTVHYTHEGKTITFEIVNKRLSLMEFDSSIEEADPVPENTLKRILKSIFGCCFALKTRRAKTKSLSTFRTA